MLEKSHKGSHMRLPALQFQPYQSLLLFFCFAPLIYLHTCSRPNASRKTHSDLEPLLFMVQWSMMKAQAHMWSTKSSFLSIISSSSFFLFLAPSRVSRPLLFVLYSLSLLFISFFLLHTLTSLSLFGTPRPKFFVQEF